MPKQHLISPALPDRGDILLFVERVFLADLIHHAANLFLVALKVLRGEVDTLADNAHVVLFQTSCGNGRCAYYGNPAAGL